ncbi:MAG TPA: glycosyltransferase family 9 protein [Steroidobacteraceae bacterium]|nr:glycosyltransferase family 9 protein [Steroidobacteraceae bacterium]
MAARPLVMRCGAFGDMVLLTPLIRELAARFGSDIDIVSSGGWTRPLLEGQPGVGRLYLVKSRRRPYPISPDQWHLVRALRERGAGPTWFLDPGAIGRRLLTRGGIGEEWIVDVEAHPRLPGEHYLEWFWRVAAVLPKALVEAPPAPARHPVEGCVIEVGDPGRREAAAWLATLGIADRPLLAVQAGNKRTMRRGDRRRTTNTKYWPEERWGAVIDAMAARCPEHAILLLGVPSEHALNEDIRRHARAARVLNVAADLPVPRLMALLERTAGMVSVDTGPAHAAAAVGVPLVVLFGAADPALYRPRGAAGAATCIVRADPPGPLENLSAAAVCEAFATLPLRAAPAHAA